jgi:hypothetical protein
MNIRTLKDLERLVGMSDDHNDEEPVGGYRRRMSETTQFLTLPIPDADDRDPDSQIVRLSAKWRQTRGLDDSGENIQKSIIAIMRQHPELGQAYHHRPDEVARFGESAFDKVEIVR